MGKAIRILKQFLLEYGSWLSFVSSKDDLRLQSASCLRITLSVFIGCCGKSSFGVFQHLIVDFDIRNLGCSLHWGKCLQLLAPDPALSRFKSYKKSVNRLKRFSDVLTIVVAAGMLYFCRQFEQNI